MYVWNVLRAWVCDDNIDNEYVDQFNSEHNYSTELAVERSVLRYKWPYRWLGHTNADQVDRLLVFQLNGLVGHLQSLSP